MNKNNWPCFLKLPNPILESSRMSREFDNNFMIEGNRDVTGQESREKVSKK